MRYCRCMEHRRSTKVRNNPRVGAYLRVSTSEQNTDIQDREIQQYRQAPGWDLIPVDEDKAPGTHAGRPAFQRLMKDAKSRKLDIVLCWKLDRFSPTPYSNLFEAEFYDFRRRVHFDGHVHLSGYFCSSSPLLPKGTELIL